MSWVKRALRAPKWMLCASLAAVAGVPSVSEAGTMGLIISEFMPDPPGNDGAQEYVELIATRSINFAVTPYSVIFVSNPAAKWDGWINAGGVAYGFSIASGAVEPGDVVYVGGTAMAPTGTKLHVHNIATEKGDRIGNAKPGGALGNGDEADGIAVFDGLISDLTGSSVPIDAVFYGTTNGGAVYNGVGGYQLPDNDLYDGGKLQTNSFRIDRDPTPGTPFIAVGSYDAVTDDWLTTRTFSTATATDGVSAIQLRLFEPPPPPPPPTAVPLPAAAWGGAALLGMLGMRQRLRRRSER